MKWHTKEEKAKIDKEYFGFWIKVSKKEYDDLFEKLQKLNNDFFKGGYRYSLKFDEDKMQDNIGVFFEEIPEGESISIEFLGKSRLMNVTNNKLEQYEEDFFDSKFGLQRLLDTIGFMSDCESLMFFSEKHAKLLPKA